MLAAVAIVNTASKITTFLKRVLTFLFLQILSPFSHLRLFCFLSTLRLGQNSHAPEAVAQLDLQRNVFHTTFYELSLMRFKNTAKV